MLTEANWLVRGTRITAVIAYVLLALGTGAVLFSAALVAVFSTHRVLADVLQELLEFPVVVFALVGIGFVATLDVCFRLGGFYSQSPPTEVHQGTAEPSATMEPPRRTSRLEEHD